MRTERVVITDRSWEIIEPLLPGSICDRGRTAKDNRLFLEAILWKVRVGSPWRDLPEGFVEWNNVFRRFCPWAQLAVFQRLFESVSGDPDFEYILVDGTIVSVNNKTSGAKEGLSIRPSVAAIGSSLVQKPAETGPRSFTA